MRGMVGLLWVTSISYPYISVQNQSHFRAPWSYSLLCTITWRSFCVCSFVPWRSLKLILVCILQDKGVSGGKSQACEYTVEIKIFDDQRSYSLLFSITWQYFWVRSFFPWRSQIVGFGLFAFFLPFWQKSWGEIEDNYYRLTSRASQRL